MANKLGDAVKAKLSPYLNIINSGVKNATKETLGYIGSGVTGAYNAATFAPRAIFGDQAVNKITGFDPNLAKKYAQNTTPYKIAELGGNLATGVASGQGIKSIGLNTALGGIIGGASSKIGGGSFTQGAFSGAKNALEAGPTINLIAGATQPLINSGVGKLAPKLATSPLGQMVAGRALAGVGNVAQGMLINKSVNQPNTPLSTGLDFALGVAGGHSNKSELFGFNQLGKMGKVDGKDIGYITRNMDSFDRDLMENFIDTIRLRKGGNVQLEIDARRMAEAMGINADVPNATLANKFEKILSAKIMAEAKVASLTSGKGDMKKIDEIMKEYTPERAKAQAERLSKELENPKNPYYNVKRMGVSNETKQGVADMIQTPQMQKQVSGVIGDPLTFKEIQTKAQLSPELKSTKTRADAEKLGAEALALRNKVAELSSLGVNDAKFQEALIKDKAFGTFIARLLGQRRIVSNPEQSSIFNEMVSKILKEGADPDKVLAEAKKVDFNNFEEASQFYRKFIKTKPSDWIETIRYSSMLSSPNTWISNASSNAQGTGLVAPIEKTITGGLDWIQSAFNPKRQRQYYVGEGAKYAQGYYSSLGKAFSKFGDVMSGKSSSDLQELTNIPMAKKGSISRGVEDVLKFPSKVLQGTDEFFRTLTQGGVESSLKYRQSKSGVEIPNIKRTAELEARKRLFNSEFGLDEEGTLLKAIEYIPQKVAEARNSSNPIVKYISRFTFPFVRIPSNILKQSVEYSPTGLLTMVGAKNKKEQLAKAIMGSSMALAGGVLASSGRLTFGEPTNEEQKNQFRSAGLQPYSIKIGENWVSFSKFHPVISFNLALAAAYNDAVTTQKLGEDDLDLALSTGAKWLNFFADQSYVKNMGDLVSGLKGDSFAISKYISNYPTQLIPYRAMMSWMARLFDPYQRKIDPDGTQLDKTMQQIMSQLPILSQKLEPRMTEDGKPIENQNRIFNAVSPVGRVTKENPAELEKYKQLQEESMQRKNEDVIREALKSGKDNKLIITSTTGVRYGVAGGTVIYLDEDGKAKKIQLGWSLDTKLAQLTGNNALDKRNLTTLKSDVTGRISDLLDLTELGVLPKEQTRDELLQLDAYRNRLNRILRNSPTTLQDTALSRQRSDINSQIQGIVKAVRDGDVAPSQANTQIVQLEAQLKSLKKPKISRGGGGRVRKVKVSKPKAIKTKAYKFKKPKKIKVKKLKVRNI